MTDPSDTPTPPKDVTALSDVLQDALRRLVTDSRERILRAADDGRAMLRVRALQRDRDALWLRLGKIAYRLQESGEVEHPAIAKAMRHVDELDEEIRRLKDEVARAEASAGER